MMGQTTDIGTRVELVSMDKHFEGISIGLYRQDSDARANYLVKTYSQRPRVAERLGFICSVMVVLGGLETNSEGLLSFPCGVAHEKAMRRIFMDACKIASGETVGDPVLTIFDKKAEADITAVPLGGGRNDKTKKGEKTPRRISAIARGLIKLAEMEEDEHSEGKLSFECGCSHDALIGALMVRAQNVRAALRESEESMSRGVLAAPSNN